MGKASADKKKREKAKLAKKKQQGSLGVRVPVIKAANSAAVGNTSEDAKSWALKTLFNETELRCVFTINHSEPFFDVVYNEHSCFNLSPSLYLTVLASRAVFQV
tara:strand:+ start:172 stop:483 length:312 start_codon:yes stop_codon:yes gene_type:complete